MHSAITGNTNPMKWAMHNALVALVVHEIASVVLAVHASKQDGTGRVAHVSLAVSQSPHATQPNEMRAVHMRNEARWGAAAEERVGGAT